MTDIDLGLKRCTEWHPQKAYPVRIETSLESSRPDGCDWWVRLGVGAYQVRLLCYMKDP